MAAKSTTGRGPARPLDPDPVRGWHKLGENAKQQKQQAKTKPPRARGKRGRG